MKSPRWKFLHFNDAKPHAVCARLSARLRRDLQARGHDITDSRPTRSTGLDHGGMTFVGRPFRTYQIAGLKVSFPCDCMSDFARQLRGTARRTFADGTPYYKLHCRWNCIVLSPTQRTALLGAMEADIAEAARIDSEWWATVESKLDKKPAAEVRP